MNYKVSKKEMVVALLRIVVDACALYKSTSKGQFGLADAL